MSEQQVHIELDGVGKAFPSENGPESVLEGISLKVRRGEFVTFFGPNGCGKTTLLNVIAGIETVDNGSATIHCRAGATAQIGYIFQDYRDNLMPWLTVAQNIAFPLKIKGVRRAERQRRVEALLERFQLKLDLRARTYNLSGGQAQLTSILRSLIIDPEILIMDEPFSALDYQTNLSLYDKVLSLWRTTGVTVVLVSHALDEALYLGQRTVFLTKRPAKIRAILRNPLGNDKRIEQMEEAAFSSLRAQALTIFRQEALGESAAGHAAGEEGST